MLECLSPHHPQLEPLTIHIHFQNTQRVQSADTSDDSSLIENPSHFVDAASFFFIMQIFSVVNDSNLLFSFIVLNGITDRK